MVEPGTLVRSLAGRDAGECFVVLKAAGDFVYLANGKSRPLERPKKKRRKHLALTARTLTEEALRSNRALRAALGEHRDEGGT